MNRLLTSSDRWRLTLLGGCSAAVAGVSAADIHNDRAATFVLPIFSSLSSARWG